jgi:hypothetical protein
MTISKKGPSHIRLAILRLRGNGRGTTELTPGRTIKQRSAHLLHRPSSRAKRWHEGLGEGSRTYGVAMGNAGVFKAVAHYRRGILRSPQCLHTLLALDDVFRKRGDTSETFKGPPFKTALIYPSNMHHDFVELIPQFPT